MAAADDDLGGKTLPTAADPDDPGLTTPLLATHAADPGQTSAEATLRDVMGTLVPNPALTRADHTIKPTPQSLHDSEAGVLDELVALATPLEREVELQSTLGQGGMGIVRLARQRALQRQVAVKSVSPTARVSSAQRTLLQEAWATATLEHPNIVPVHTLAVDEDGAPHVVMRRIEGRTWRDYMAAPDRINDDFGARDGLGWHLGVLMQVCNAMHYAHSRGILHRDLKPDNVMIGRFGEVLVLDWGLAVRFTSDGPVRLPLARNETRVVGTPRFMAPEMARGQGDLLGPGTDVYLLGGLLYVLLAGEGPHSGDEVAETLAGIPTFQPQLPAGTSPRLASIVQNAMKADPAQRFASAEELRLALQVFLEERTADRLAQQAHQQLLALEHDLELDEPDRQTVYRHFGAGRFGFRQALDAWPEHEAAAEGMQRALVAMTRYELDHGDARAASVHLAELDDAPAELVQRRDALAEEERQAEAELVRLRDDLNPRLGQRTRIFVFAIVLLGWTLMPLIWWGLGEPLDYDHQLRSRGGMLLVITGLMLWARESMARTAINRRIAQTLVVLAAATVIADLGGRQLGVPVHTVATLDFVLYAVVTALLADVVGRVALLPAVAYGVGFFICVRWPELLLPVTGGTNGLVTLIALYLWARDLPPRPTR